MLSSSSSSLHPRDSKNRPCSKTCGEIGIEIRQVFAWFAWDFDMVVAILEVAMRTVHGISEEEHIWTQVSLRPGGFPAG